MPCWGAGPLFLTACASEKEPLILSIQLPCCCISKCATP
jgi:hypothetical protein